MFFELPPIYEIPLEPMYIGIIAILGLLVGSFLNVVVLRVNGKKPVTGRSHCMNCSHVLKWYELLPLFSYLWLGGKCRSCKQHISIQYPLVEFSTGLAYGMIATKFIDEPLFMLFYLVITAFLVVIFVFDFKYYLIPDLFTLPALAIAIVGSLAFGMNWLDLVIGIAIGAGFFLVQYVVSKGRWIGGGDIRLGALMGAIVGYPSIMGALFIAYMAGAAVAIPMLVMRNRGMQDQLPFGTFLTAATFVVMLTSDAIVEWYVDTVLYIL